MNTYALREADVTSVAQASWASQRCADALVVAVIGVLREVDNYTAEHSEETVDLAVLVAEALALSPRQIRLVARVAALHDIGKIAMPKQLLFKPGPLDVDEMTIMRSHPVVGERILSGIPEVADVANAIRHEHERWDGGGYPDGLAGEEIPLASRIVFACDAWHAMISDRPYQPPMQLERALAELERNAGTQFDPVVTAALLTVLRRRVLQAA